MHLVQGVHPTHCYSGVSPGEVFGEHLRVLRGHDRVMETKVGTIGSDAHRASALTLI